MEQDRTTTVRWLGWISAIVGAWLIIAPFALGLTSTSAFWNEIVVGLVAIVLGVTQASSPKTTWPSWINLIAGIWLIISPYLFNPAMAAAYTNAVVSGIILAVVALADGAAASSLQSTDGVQHGRPI